MSIHDRSKQVIVTRSADWLTARVGDELMMMSASHGEYIGLSAVGARIWELLETPRSVDALCAQLQQEFEVGPETCRADVERFIGDLVRHAAVSLAP